MSSYVYMAIITNDYRATYTEQPRAHYATLYVAQDALKE